MSTLGKDQEDNLVTITFVLSDGKEITVRSPENYTVLDAARQHDIDLEGVCEGSLACSTCHVIVDRKHFDQLPVATEREQDMLDLAFGLEACSRLSCQIILKKHLNGMRLKIPSHTRNI